MSVLGLLEGVFGDKKRERSQPLVRQSVRGGAGKIEREGENEREKRRYLVFNSKQFAHDICDLFKYTSFSKKI
jgi:hypothetical protein